MCRIFPVGIWFGFQVQRKKWGKGGMLSRNCRGKKGRGKGNQQVLINQYYKKISPGLNQLLLRRQLLGERIVLLLHTETLEYIQEGNF